MSKLYTERDIIEQGDYYSRHTSAMTGEDLHSKSDIAAELAHRDIEIDKLKARVAAQQSALNSICTCSWGAAEFFDVGKAASWMQKIAYDALDEVPSTEAFILRKQAEAVQASRQAVSVPEWTDINLRQPEEYQDVLWFCQGGNIRTGMYYGKTHCDRVPETHPISRRGRSHYGKFGRYADPAESGHVVTHWMPLPQPPKQGQDHE